jgi:hypothetical protein
MSCGLCLLYYQWLQDKKSFMTITTTRKSLFIGLSDKKVAFKRSETTITTNRNVVEGTQTQKKTFCLFFCQFFRLLPDFWSQSCKSNLVLKKTKYGFNYSKPCCFNI